MEPREIEPHLLNNALRQLVFISGLDLSGNVQHKSIHSAFNDPKRERAAQIQYKILTSENSDLFRQQRTSVSPDKGESPALKSAFHGGIIKRTWPLKYLELRPSLVATFVDLDWDSPNWLEKRIECESKINSLKQTIGQRDIKIALVLVQRMKTSLDDPMAAEKAMDICQQCRLNARHLYVFPQGSDQRSTFECIARLEIAFHEITQDSYQSCFKRIRARSVPNNDSQLLLRQQYKLAFLSELREDRHSALRYYKQAFQTCGELNLPDVDAFELFTVAGLLNFKVCELNFILNSPVEALNQFRKHQIMFFGREAGVYPSKELANIELSWWKSQQCRQFAELFTQAIGIGLAAYPSQNPGRFLEEAGGYYKCANALVRQLRARLAQTDRPQRQNSPFDPLQSFDLNVPTLYFGQRPWRVQQTGPVGASRSQGGQPALAPLNGNQQLLEHAAKLFLETNVRENYVHSQQLFSSAIAQFKRYNCTRFATMVYMDMADEHFLSKQFGKALQILRHVCTELRGTSFRPFLREVLVKTVNCAFCLCSLDDWIWAITQLLFPIWTKQSNSTSSAEEVHEEAWTERARQFLVGEPGRLPFPIQHPTGLLSREDIDLATHQWKQLDSKFHLDLTRFGSVSFLQCNAKFVTDGLARITAGERIPSVHAGEPILVEVNLRNFSRVPVCFTNAQLVLEQCWLWSGRSHLTLDKWLVPNAKEADKDGGGAKIELPSGNGATIQLFFFFMPSLAQSNLDIQQQQMPARSQSPSPKRNELTVFIRKFTLDSPNGTFFWEIEGSIHHQQQPVGRASAPSPAAGILSTPMRPPNCSGSTECNCVGIRVLPQRNMMRLKGPEQILLHTDESIDIAFVLENTTEEHFKNVRIICNKVYKDEEQNGGQNRVIQHSFIPPFNDTRPNNTLLLNEHSGEDGRTLVPVFNQQVATYLGLQQSTDFTVRIQSKSSNCIGLQIQVNAILPKENLSVEGWEPVESLWHFPINCIEALSTETAVYCENGERSQCLVQGQNFRIEAKIKLAPEVDVLGTKWNLNSPLVERCPRAPLADLITSQLEKLELSRASEVEEGCSFCSNSLWIYVPLLPAFNGADSHQFSLGDLLIEWRCTSSCEPVRSIISFGQLPCLTAPISIQAELISPNENNSLQNFFYFELGQRFGLRYTLRNTTELAKALPLAVHLEFEETEGILCDGIIEDHLMLFPGNDQHSFVQSFVPLRPGQMPFPRPRIKCISGTPNRPAVEVSNEELDRLNKLIATHTFNSLPKEIFVMP